MTHPLTDKMIQAICHNIHAYDDTRPLRADMRATADWQLEQVLIWLKNELACSACSAYIQSNGYSGYEIDVDYVIEDLKQAMRPKGDNS